MNHSRIVLQHYAFSLMAVASCLTSCQGIQFKNADLLENQPQQNAAFAREWTFDAAPDPTQTYAFSGSSIEFTGGVCRLKPSDQVDDDNSASGFAGGNLTGVAWDSASSSIRLSQSGTPLNRAEFDSSWTPQWSGLLGYWKFEGDWQDSKGTNPLTAGGNASFSSDSKVGASAATFDGMTDNATGTLTEMANFSWDSDFTLSAWLKYDPAYDNPWDSMAKPFTFNCTGGSYLFNIWLMDAASGTSGEIRMYRWTGGALSTSIHSSIRLGNARYYHLVFLNRGNTSEMYVDGTLIGSANDSSVTGATCNQFTIGDNNYKGQIDELAFWGTGLTGAEVLKIYERQKSKYSGQLVSRVMDAFQTGMSWTTFSWAPTLPFLKPLPDFNGAVQNETSDTYSSLVGSTGATHDDDLMSGIEGLWHLDESTGTTGAGSVRDDSGHGKHAEPTNVILGRPGMLGTSAAFNGASTMIASSAVLPVPFTAVSFSAWMRPTGSGGNIMSQRYSDNGAGVFMDAVLGPGTNYIRFGRSVFFTTPVNSISPEEWTLVTMTIGADGTARLYINGVFSTSGAVGTADYDDSCGFTIGMARGAFCANGASHFNGRIDEVAVWTRELHAAEIHQLYRRGANRIKFQVRSCTAADCSDDASGASWKGPDGTNQSYFSELNNNSVALDASGVVKPTSPSMLLSDFTSPPGTSRYFQYRALLESDDHGSGCDYGSGATWCSPELRSVTVDPVHYDSSSPTVIGKAGTTYQSLSSFNQSYGTGCSSEASYTLGRGTAYSSATWYWWDATKAADCVAAGSGSWCPANGTALQSNDAATIAARISSFAAQAGTGSLFYQAFLKSNGTAGCDLDWIRFSGER